MLYRTLGRSNLRVSALGLGCMGMSEFYAGRDDAQSLQTLLHALNHGINFLDTADMYGPFTNEQLVGRAIREWISSGRGKREDLIIATKFGIQRDAANPAFRAYNSTPAYIHHACEASLTRLGLETIDLYFQHRVDPNTPIEDTVSAMATLVKAGKIRHIGLSEAAPDTIRRAAAVAPITALQSEFSLWTRDYESTHLPLLRELGIGLVAYCPLGRGFLTGKLKSISHLPPDDFRSKNPRFQGDNLQHNLRIVEQLEALAHQKYCTPGQLAIAWVLAQGNDIVPIPGTKRIAYLDENLAALHVTLTPEDLQTLHRIAPPGQTAGERYTPNAMPSINREAPK